MEAVQVDGGENVGNIRSGNLELGEQFDLAMAASTRSFRVTVTKYSWSTCIDTTPVRAR